MALIGYEGFDHENGTTGTTFAADIPLKPYSTGVNSQSGISGGRWSNSNGNKCSKISGLIGGFALQLITDTTPTYTCTLTANYTTIIHGFRIFTPGARTTTTDFFRLMDGATVQCGLSINTSGNITFWRGTNATVLATGATVLATLSWYYVEIRVKIDSSAGTVQVNLASGTNAMASEITASSINTQNSGAAQTNAFVLCSSGLLGTAFDDLYSFDTTGAAPFNTFLGNAYVETLFPSANSAVTFTPLASTNVSQISETNMDSDTSYNWISGTGSDDFTNAGLSSSAYGIFAISITVSSARDDYLATNMQTEMISGGITQRGTSNPISILYYYFRDVFLTDPGTGTAWYWSAINAMTFGYRRV